MIKPLIIDYISVKNLTKWSILVLTTWYVAWKVFLPLESCMNLNWHISTLYSFLAQICLDFTHCGYNLWTAQSIELMIADGWGM